MGVYKRGGVWWYKFTWDGEPIRESTKQSKKRTAEKIEAAHKTSLAKGEVGIRDKAQIPLLKDFAEHEFLPFLEAQFQDKPKTLSYYKSGLKKLADYSKLANATLETITPGDDLGVHCTAARRWFRNLHYQLALNKRFDACSNLLLSGASQTRCCRAFGCCQRIGANGFSRPLRKPPTWMLRVRSDTTWWRTTGKLWKASAR